MSADDWTEGGAEFGGEIDARTLLPSFRHHLWRARPRGLFHPKATAGQRLGVCLHNPSRAGADPRDNDPTVTKVIGFAERWGFTRIDVVNLGDYIATNPVDFYACARRRQVATPRGDEHLRQVAATADVFLVGWGRLDDRWARSRAAEVLRMIARPVVCIRQTTGGYPAHPVREPYTTEPLPFAGVRPHLGGADEYLSGTPPR